MLYIISTPIGNLEDITLRALRCLRECDYILCEDTRHSSKLLNHYDIHKPLVSFHQWNEKAKQDRILADLQQGKNIALISDAGTPLLADPGFDLVRMCRQQVIPLTAVPGPSAALCALTLSGMAPIPFQFVGFLPKKEGLLQETLEELLEYAGTSLCYESPQRIQKTLQILCELAPARTIALARELTKRFESVVVATASELYKRLEEEEMKGECVLLIEGEPHSPSSLFSKELLQACVEDVIKTQNSSTKQAIAQVSKQLQLPKKVVYAAIAIK